MNPYILSILKFFPILSILFTSWVCAVLFMTLDGMSYAFAFIAVQFYANWILVILGNKPWEKTGTEPANIATKDVWFCRKCDLNFPYNVEHCPLCKKCSAFRDHHCFFLGTCINIRNMKYFIIMQLYTILVCTYVICKLTPYLSMEFQRDSESGWQFYMKFFYPVMFLLWISGSETFHLFSLSLLLGLLVSIAATVPGYLVYQLHRIVSGGIYKYKTPDTNRSASDNLIAVFGPWGFLHFLVPFLSSRKSQLNFHLPIHQS